MYRTSGQPVMLALALSPLHLIAFVVIGIVIAIYFMRGTTGATSAVRFVLPVIGSLVGGYLGLAVLGVGSVAKYGSLVVAIVLSLIAGGVASGLARRR